jgi:hypothetical protein
MLTAVIAEGIMVEVERFRQDAVPGRGSWGLLYLAKMRPAEPNE